MLAWFITNGHAYMLLGLGIALDIEWMRWYGGAYLSILWLPITPEKLITIPIALFLYRIIYKNKFPIQEEGEQNDTRCIKETRTKSN